ncbi:hypothetical protein CDAR_503391 [Caerostris darwini]|uniref:Uncharacterized protein n=1 Tax=Caerostris darwini TaxID=1538125 RepID=A0AAV4NZB7_9ARAC|nr:hypothetical protein CDAR_503321 [Caerostris darwini]GIX89301.1 hypothetical protein CDAR_503391 [Caerostris darwini]
MCESQRTSPSGAEEQTSSSFLREEKVPQRMHSAACSIVSYSSSCPILLFRLTDDALRSRIAKELFGFSKRKEGGIIQRGEIFFQFSFFCSLRYRILRKQ